MNMKKSKNKKEPKFIDQLHRILTTAGLEVNRDGWNDWSIDKSGNRSKEKDDFCEWIEISLYAEDGTKHDVHFYFSDNSKKLDSVSLYKCKKKKGYKSGKLIAASKDKAKQIEALKEKVKPTTIPAYLYC